MAYTDDGAVHEHRGLKGRSKGRLRPGARRPARQVPVPPQLVAMLRDHIQAYGTAPDGRIFRSEAGNPIQPSTGCQVWQKVRAASLTPEQLATPLMKRPYDLRHSGITTISAPSRIRTCAPGSGEFTYLTLSPLPIPLIQQFWSAVGARESQVHSAPALEGKHSTWPDLAQLVRCGRHRERSLSYLLQRSRLVSHVAAWRGEVNRNR